MIFTLLALALQAATPTAPTPPTPPMPSADGFLVGTDTLQSVVAKLGKPITTMHNSDGTTIAVWASNHTRMKGSTFVPVVGLFAGGAKVQMSRLRHSPLARMDCSRATAHRIPI